MESLQVSEKPKSEQFQEGREPKSETLLLGGEVKPVKVVTNLVKFVIFAAVVAVLLAASVIGRYESSVYIEDIVTISAEGANGYGQIYASIDSEKLAEAVENGSLELTSEGKRVSSNDMSALASCFNKLVTIYWDGDTEAVANGDTVGYSLKVNKDIFDYLKTGLKTESREYTVEGLVDAEVFDPFEGVTLEYTFLNSSLGYSATITYEGEYLTAEDFELSEYNGLKEGEQITIKLKNSHLNSYAESIGIYPSSLSKEIVVEIP